jgi:predicted permease
LATEGALLSTAGSTVGFVMAPVLSGAVLGFLPPDQEPALASLRFTLDARVVGFVGGLIVLTTTLFGVLPAVWATRSRAALTIQTGPASDRLGRGWIGRGLVIAEVAMCTLLLVVAGVFVRTVHNLRNQDAGYVEDKLLVADVPLPGNSDERRWRLLDDLRQRVLRLPNVDAVAFSDLGQLSGSGIEFSISVPGQPPAAGQEPAEAFEQRISAGFLSAMGTRLIAGREFTDADIRSETGVALVNEAFARRYLAPGLAIGQRFTRETGARGLTVIGVVTDSKWVNLRDDSPAMYYVPLRSFRPVARMVVRTTGDLSVLAPAVADIGRAMDPDVRLANVVPFREIVNRTMVAERLVAHVSSALAVLGLLIACIGLYGLLAYAVVRRRREIGIRIAVGASPGRVEWMMIRESLTLVAAGVAIGVPAAFVITRLASSLLFGLSPGDPPTIAAVTAALASATLVAAYLPARRAATLDPARVLREE